jgi:hypothetical protein
MSQLETIAASFRAGLIPAVARKTPWAKMTGESQLTYCQATETALLEILADRDGGRRRAASRERRLAPVRRTTGLRDGAR